MYRVGRKVGRTIYQQTGPAPSDDDTLVGVMDTPELAALFVSAANQTRPRERAQIFYDGQLSTDEQPRWGWQCSACGEVGEGYGNATTAREAADNHDALCKESP